MSGAQSDAKSTAALLARVSELENELGRVCGQLAEAEAALGAAEADIRDEVVGEIQVGRLGGWAVG